MASLVADLIFRKYKTVEKTAHIYGGGSGADLRCNLVPILKDANTETSVLFTARQCTKLKIIAFACTKGT